MLPPYNKSSITTTKRHQHHLPNGGSSLFSSSYVFSYFHNKWIWTTALLFGFLIVNVNAIDENRIDKETYVVIFSACKCYSPYVNGGKFILKSKNQKKKKNAKVETMSQLPNDKAYENVEEVDVESPAIV
uniref:Uncharacterized protein n=1 Tax=Glossina brevipalpis TaxID=37001 RepID=A0A1A9X3M2_9MUSC